MPDDALRAAGVKVGADVPFCLGGGCCLAQGIGELLTPLPYLPRKYAIALVKPECSISTARAYAAIDATELRRPDTARAIALAKRGDWESLFPLCENVFEQAVPLPGLEQARAEAMRRGALLCRMTGSGSAVFAVYPRDLENPDGILRALEGLGGEARVYGPVERGVKEVCA
jgi:4-diphosphocytidyl-2-C-methyl-D-erythritol kinase